ncbi:hypothetical protein EDB80DRAFT_706074 [Ilyonectria destructans]|nr:hypothetical protein EDB80DRAFT_706074 [Ilyonectria destructans]
MEWGEGKQSLCVAFWAVCARPGCGLDCSLWVDMGKEVGMRDGGWKRDGPCSETREMQMRESMNQMLANQLAHG